MPKIILGLGSNVGNREANLQAAIDGIKTFVRDLRLSSVLESAALLPEGAPDSWNMDFFNMAVMGECALTPLELLNILKRLEAAIGRVKQGHWSPREIDIDILGYGEELHRLEDLYIPHAHLLERDFALLPFVELWPDWCYPLEGAYRGWRACDIATDKGYGYSDNLKKIDITLHAG